MKALQSLPNGYEQIFSVNLQKNKKVATLITIASIVVALIMVVIGAMLVPITWFIDTSDGLISYIIRLGVLSVAMIAYIILHELVHGITMKIFGAKKIKYGITLKYAYAGCDDYFDKTSYIIIALAPVVVFGIVLAVLNFIVLISWFWTVYVVQICNLSGAAGDAYVTAKFCRMPKDILVNDTGVEMTVFAPAGSIEVGNKE